jgi:hypothetical protein
MTAALDICVSANSGLVHVEEKATGRNVATMTMKAATKEEKIDMALLFAASPDLRRELEHSQRQLKEILDYTRNRSPDDIRLTALQMQIDRNAAALAAAAPVFKKEKV